MQAVGIALRGALGILTGLALCPVVFLWSLIKGARAVHGDGVVYRAELRAAPDDAAATGAAAAVGARLHGPAIARLSGAFHREGSPEHDVLGLALRLQRDASDELTVGDQDLLLGTFESFRTAGRDQAATDETDYLASANLYHSVSPWRVDGLGVVKLRARPRPGDVTPDPARGASRAGRLAADVADGRAVLRLEVDGDGSAALADLHLIAPLASDGRALRISLGRSGRGIRAVGYRNGIRRVVYPVSQLARRLRGR